MRGLSDRAVAAVAAAVIVSSQPAAHAAEPDTLSLAPSSDWHLNYDDDGSCRVWRMFGEGDDRVAFAVERYGPDDAMFMIVAGQPMAGNARGDVYIQFGPAEQRASVEANDGDFGEFSPALIMPRIRFEPYEWQLAEYDPKKGGTQEDEGTPSDIFGQDFSPEREAAIEWLAVDRSGGKHVVLELGPMGDPMMAMRACTYELLNHWGIDVARHRALTRMATPRIRPSLWLGPEDYPAGLLRKEVPGLVRYRLSVDERGKPSQCHIQRSSRPEAFDKAVCRALMRRARFNPALDANGEPLLSFYLGSVRFTPN